MVTSITSMNMNVTIDKPTATSSRIVNIPLGLSLSLSMTWTWTFGVGVRLRLGADLTGVGRSGGVARDADDRVRFTFDGDFIVCLRYLLACDGCT